MSKKTKKEKLILNRLNLILTAIPVAGVIIKHLLFAGFLSNNNPYIPDIGAGIAACASYLPLSLAVMGLLFGFMILFKEKGRHIYAISVDAVFTVLLLVDLIYYRAFNTIPSALMLHLSKAAASMDFETIMRVSRWDLLFLIDFALYALLFLILRKKAGTGHSLSFRKRLLHCLAVLGISALILVFVPIMNAIGIMKNAYSDCYKPAYPEALSYRFTLLGFHAYDFYKISHDDTNINNEEVEQIRQFYEWNNEALPDNEYSSVFKDKNLLIIQVESLEDFVIGESIDGVEVTPYLNRLLSKSFYFPNIYEQVKCGNSSDCDFMAETSLLPAARGITTNDYTRDTLNTLPKMLENMGYSTTYYNSDSESVWNYSGVVTSMLDFNRMFMDFKKDELLNGYLSDKSMLSQVFAEIQSDDSYSSGKFYSHIVLASSHIPFKITDELSVLPDTEELKDTTVHDYLNLMHYVDEQIGTILDNLRNEGLLDNTVVAIYGDHGGIHRYYPSECAEIASEKGYEWVGTGYTVPLIIYSESLDKGAEIETIGGQIDIMPTLCGLFGIDHNLYSETAMGKNLLNTNRDFAILPNGRIVGEVSDEDRRIINLMYKTSNLIIEKDYFAQK